MVWGLVCCGASFAVAGEDTGLDFRIKACRCCVRFWFLWFPLSQYLPGDKNMIYSVLILKSGYLNRLNPRPWAI